MWNEVLSGRHVSMVQGAQTGTAIVMQDSVDVIVVTLRREEDAVSMSIRT